MFADGEDSQPVAVEEIEAGILPDELLPQPPHTETVAPLVGVVKEDNRALRQLRQPAPKVVRDGRVGVQSVDMQEIDGVVRDGAERVVERASEQCGEALYRASWKHRNSS